MMGYVIATFIRFNIKVLSTHNLFKNILLMSLVKKKSNKNEFTKHL